MELRVENLEYVYNPGTALEQAALRDVSFSLSTGKVLGILGGTGSGKTTLIRNLNGLLVPTRGRVLLDGMEAGSLGSKLRRRVGVVFQRPERQLFEETVYKDVSFVLRRFSDLPEPEIREKVARACGLLGLDVGLIGDRRPTHLSECEKRKVVIAAILVNDPDVLILDEPAVGLDPPSVTDLVLTIRRLKETGDKSVVIVSHDMDPFLSVLNLVLVLDQGRVKAFGSPWEVCSELRTDPGAKDLLPELVLLIHELRDAGYPIPPNEFRVSVLADEIASVLALRGGSC